jgi:hypothetical protein
LRDATGWHYPRLPNGISVARENLAGIPRKILLIPKSPTDCFYRYKSVHFAMVKQAHTTTTMTRDLHPEWFDVSLSILIQQGLVEETDDRKDVPHYKLTAEGMEEGKQAKEAMYKGFGTFRRVKTMLLMSHVRITGAVIIFVYVVS